MNLEFSDEQRMLREEVRPFLAANADLKSVRPVLDGGASARESKAVDAMITAADARRHLDPYRGWLESAVQLIAGGSDEILRNTIAEQALRLPGDIRTVKDVPLNQIP
jgi:alkylation response protein AidB-like acyl-CoA dehydrogenase